MEIEECLASSPDVAECAVLGINDPIKGEVPCGLIVLKTGVDRDPAEIEKEIVGLVRDKIGPVAAFKIAITVPRLPKTRSGKILRGTIKKMADKEPWTMPATIEDPKVYSKPWTVNAKLHLLPGEELIEHICEENNRNTPNEAGFTTAK